MFVLLVLLPILLACVHIDPAALSARAERIREALRMADISFEKACLYMEIDKGQFSRQLAGEGHVSETRMLALPSTFWSAYSYLGACEFGLPDFVSRGVQVTAAIQHREQARMDMAYQAERRTA